MYLVWVLVLEVEVVALVAGVLLEISSMMYPPSGRSIRVVVLAVSSAAAWGINSEKQQQIVRSNAKNFFHYTFSFTIVLMQGQC